MMGRRRSSTASRRLQQNLEGATAAPSVLRRRADARVGASPGSLQYTGPTPLGPVRVDYTTYDADAYDEVADIGIDEAIARSGSDTGVCWIHVNGVHDTSIIERIGQAYDLHPLTLEDIVASGQRPKVEPYDDYLFVVLRMLWLEHEEAAEADPPLLTEQLSIVLLDGVLLTFQELPGDDFEPVRERARQGKGRIRKMAADYLAYALMDLVVDRYYTLLEEYDEAIENLEATMLEDPTTATLGRANRLKRNLQTVRRAVWPLREVMATLLREDGRLLSPQVVTFLRDAHDHTVQLIETLESLRELLNGLHDVYLSLSSYRMNEVMKVLTIIATIFIPLTFLVGVYGMNFVGMPELAWRWGYPVLWLLMLAIVAGMILLFRRARWL